MDHTENTSFNTTSVVASCGYRHRPHRIHHFPVNQLLCQDYWVFGLCPSSGILETRKQNFSETGSVSVLRWGGGKTPTLLSPLERANLNHRSSLMFSQQWRFTLWSCGSWHHVVCQVVTKILEKQTVSIFRVKVKMVAEIFFRILVTTYKLTSCYNSEHINMGITTCHTIYYTCLCSFTLGTYVVWSNNIRIVIFFCDNSIYLLAHNIQSFLATSCGESRSCIILGSMCVGSPVFLAWQE
jgi:hypothetical protein